MTYVLGVDPGVISGWGLLGTDGRPITWGQTGKPGRRTTGVDVERVLQECFAECDPADLVLAVEGQFVLAGGGKGGASHGQTLSTLVTARIRGMWEGAAEAAGLELFAEDGIQPTTWRSAVWGGRWTTEAAKRNAVEMAAHVWGIRLKKGHHHVGEGLWIAKYASDVLRMRERC